MTSHDPARDFDFLFGSWLVEHRRLTVRLAEGREWEEFDGTAVAWPILGGRANIDDNVINLPGGTYRASSLRSFDQTTNTWAIWWLDGRAPHQLDVPVVGSFADARGVFYANDTVDGQPILVRFVWEGTTGESPRWEQAFSADGGKRWEMNWSMTFRRP